MMQAGRCAVVIDSIGTASPGKAIAIARGLNLAVDETIRAIYRAPAVLAPAIDDRVAEGLCEVLRELGFEASISQADELPAPTTQPLFDAALHIGDPLATAAVAEIVADFCGIASDAAFKLVTEPPAIVLGGVSAATVAALELRLAEHDVVVIASEPAVARFDLFAAGLPATVAARLLGELDRAGHAVPPGEGIVATGLERGFADGLWRKYGRSGTVRIVDQAFLRFDLVLDGLEPGASREHAQAEALTALFGIPADLLDDLLAAAPATLASDLGYGEFDAALARLSACGLSARAELATFRPVALEIAAATDADAVAHEMAALGLLDRAVTLPLITPPMPAPLARLARARLEAAGAEVWIAADPA